MRAPTPQQQLLVALDSALAATVDFGIRVLKAPRWQPAPDSEASREVTSLPTRWDGSAWDEDTARWTYAAASLLMTGVIDNLGSIRDLIGEPMPAIGPRVLTRSAMEIGATAWWLMEPGIGVRHRTCRHLVLSLVSSRRAAQRQLLRLPFPELHPGHAGDCGSRVPQRAAHRLDGGQLPQPVGLLFLRQAQAHLDPADLQNGPCLVKRGCVVAAWCAESVQRQLGDGLRDALTAEIRDSRRLILPKSTKQSQG